MRVTRSARQPTAWSREKAGHLKFVRGLEQSKWSQLCSAIRQRELKTAAQNTRSLLQMGFLALELADTLRSESAEDLEPASAARAMAKEFGKSLSTGTSSSMPVGLTGTLSISRGAGIE